MSLVPSAYRKTMSHNRQSAINTNFGMSYDNYGVTNTRSGWIPQNDQLAKICQTQQWPHVEQQVWQSPTFHPNSQIHHHWGQQAIDNRSLNVMQQAVPYSAPAHLPTRTFAPNLQARITLIPNTSGGYKATIAKHKRNRTMFTTEQIQSLESFFKNKPYITREERQIFVNNLHISDSAVKVWFQNRRLREKREREEREAEALELSNSLQEETLYYSQHNPHFEISTPALTATTNDLSNFFSTGSSFDANPVTDSVMEMGNSSTTTEFDIDHLLNTTYEKMTKCVTNRISHNNEDSGVDSDSSRITIDSIASKAIDCNTNHTEKVNVVETTQNTSAIINTNKSSSPPSLDEMEADFKKKTDEFGYVTLDDKAIGDLASVLANAFPKDVDLGALTVPEDTAEDSDSTIYAGSIYEPISPAVSEVDEQTLKAKWEPFAPEKALQRLFELHFC